MEKRISKKIPAAQVRRMQRRTRIKFKVKGTEARPRLSIFRSNSGFFAQVINDDKGHTIVALSSQALKKKHSNLETAKALGEEIAKLAKAKSIASVVFDRGGYLYHGRVKAFADGARSGGLQF